MSHRLLSSLKLLSLALLIGLTTSYVFAWTGPTAAPTGGNVSAPVNVGLSNQTKAGSLRLAGIRTSLASYINFASSADLTTKGAPFNALSLAVNGSVGATEYCDENGENCVDTLGGGGGGGTGTSCPTYDSGFVDLGASGTVHRVFTHNLGTLDTEVYVESKASTGGTNNIIDIAPNAINYFPINYMLWTDKTANTVTVGRYTSLATEARYVRVVVKKTGCVGGGGTGSIGAPDYDSGWVDFETQHVQTLTHNLGTIETLVNMEEKGDADAVIAHNVPITLKAGQPNGSYQNYGPKWFNKTTSTVDVTVPNGYENEGARYVRIRMWKTN
jgi:hypothetical protein